ncbi:transposase [Bacillus salipaludis]|uniref:Transposase n=1 Tax=Bacillus salipaludis TaxID=2547811 RepID=A0ABW8RHC9_9BACI
MFKPYNQSEYEFVSVEELFIGYLYGIRSERQLEREIKMNIPQT